MDVFRDSHGYECIVSLFGTQPEDYLVVCVDQLLNIQSTNPQHKKEFHRSKLFDADSTRPVSIFIPNQIDQPIYNPQFKTILNLDALNIVRDVFQGVRYGLSKTRLSFDPLFILDQYSFNASRLKLIVMLLDRFKNQPSDIFANGMNIMEFVNLFTEQNIETRDILLSFFVSLAVDHRCFIPNALQHFQSLTLLDATPIIQEEILEFFTKISHITESHSILQEVHLVDELISDFNLNSGQFLPQKLCILNNLFDSETIIDLFLERCSFKSFESYLHIDKTRNLAFCMFQVNFKNVLYF